LPDQPLEELKYLLGSGGGRLDLKLRPLQHQPGRIANFDGGREGGVHQQQNQDRGGRGSRLNL